MTSTKQRNILKKMDNYAREDDLAHLLSQAKDEVRFTQELDGKKPNK